ncbi:hypothetical protein RV18_GL003527 [Enterococcus termitis]|nr:hypothetical protein RV18_GL003527 [Enterococcus termitis]
MLETISVMNQASKLPLDGDTLQQWYRFCQRVSFSAEAKK